MGMMQVLGPLVNVKRSIENAQSRTTRFRTEKLKQMIITEHVSLNDSPTNQNATARDPNGQVFHGENGVYKIKTRFSYINPI